MEIDYFNKLNEISDVSRETCKNLENYVTLLLEHNKKLNLIGSGTLPHIWQRHIIDSLQLAKYLSKDLTIVDFGSGAGLPGLILSIIGYDVVSVESIAKKANFQKEVAKQLGLKICVLNKRIEDVTIKNDYILTARAVAPLTKLFNLSSNLLNNKHKAVFMKGKNYKKEIIDAEKSWQFNYKTYKSITSDESVILEISKLKWK